MRKRYLLALLLVSGLYVSYAEWWQWSADIPTQTEEHQTADFYIKAIERYSFDSSGTLNNTLRAEQATRWQNDKKLYFKKPDIRFQQGPQQWRATAMQANGDPKNTDLNLTGNVVLRRSDGEIIIRTEALMFNNDKQQIISDTTVNIEASGSHTRAGKLAVNLEKQTLQLQQGVTTEYVPNPDAKPADQL